MDFFIDLAILGVMIIGMTAFLAVIVQAIVRPFVSKKGEVSVIRNLEIKKGWKKVGGKQQS
ncbi:hypothetical protein CathTA2_0283 [Caldalkalibacillus thermarum TA2.A1]|uniref:Uncharacterized protein n=1 Tax=Caldalkalibacillus thermarum (strain TA2.A1) TaxID=986075 RepID=F5L3C2_CALTT|nr:hypothetical protein [Caldalkalibacillus thermarum]EGL84153.1 hypothetical protein CathTA2_0283 [Caldalkalibacillus thermarum TA2.A1]QZT35107.1 hypothetical protein HUR95_07760 [Caldalkalibacillus thermarum TA2.A1]